ncbi:MAG: hypothetical protein LUQ24_04830 [Methanobacterium sp.]|jgi:hypothetical protein|nr:hypothetical protein [Methanobacterium sp.]
MFNGYIEVDGKKLPQTLLGSSPFIAAAQFGHRARLYQLDLYSQPENILKVIRKSYQMGVKGIQLIPYPPVVEALEMARDEGLELNILGTVRPGDEEGDIELLSTLEADAMLLHAAITDSCSWDVIAGHLNLMKDEGSVPGLATHQPFRTTRKILESSVLDLFNLYMIPVNKLGYLMDTEFFMEKERDELAELMGKMDKTIIVKKTLAAGIITPQDAFQFLEKVDYADMIALGIAYENEAEETFGLLFEE